MTEKYGSLRFIIGTSNVLGWAVILFMGVGGVASGSPYGFAAAGIGILVGIGIFASAQVFQILIDIEVNTRKIAENQSGTISKTVPVDIGGVVMQE